MRIRGLTKKADAAFLFGICVTVISLFAAVARLSGEHAKPTALRRRRNLAQLMPKLTVTQVANEQPSEEAGLGESCCISRRDGLLQLAATRLILFAQGESQRAVWYDAILHAECVVMSPNLLLCDGRFVDPGQESVERMWQSNSAPE